MDRPAEQTPPRLFLSYSHDSREHEDRVRALADRLREEVGVDAVIDQYDTAPRAGWPMWTEAEIRRADFIALVCTETYLRRVEGQEEPGIGRGVLWEAKLIYSYLYESDAGGQRFIPILFQGGLRAYIPRPARDFTFYNVDDAEDYDRFCRHITQQPRTPKPLLGGLKSLSPIPPQSYAASLESRSTQRRSTDRDRRNRYQMLRQVRADWIDGVLNQSLYQVARIELGLQMKSEAVERPLRAIVQAPDGATKAIPAGTAINQIFDDLGSALLILGDPGTGKTTLLLELARDLLGCAERDERQPIPIVLNLSSWAAKRQPLKQWIVKELNERNEVPSRVAQQWLENEQIVLLLDGLDEVSAGYRKACLEAINAFRRDQGLLPIAVCSRIADYEALGTKLRLRSAVVVQPLIESEIEHYLEQIGEPVDGLRAFLKSDPTLLELMKTPLMLWVTLLAYQDRLPDFSTSQNLEERRRQVLSTYIDAVFDRRSAEVRYDKQQTILWLHWLASAMAMRQQSIFYLETLGEDLLPTRLEKWISKIGLILGSGLVQALACGGLNLFFGEAFSTANWTRRLSGGLVGGLVLGLFAGVPAVFMDLKPADRIRISLVNVRSRLRVAMIGALDVGVGIGAIGGLVYATREWRTFFSDAAPPVLRVVAAIFLGLTGGTVVGVLLGLPLGVAFGLMKLVSGEEAIETRSTANQGTRRSLRAALLMGSLGGVFLLATGWLSSATWSSGAQLFVILAPTFGLFGGGLFVVHHLVFRIMLWTNRSAPLRYGQFLDGSVDRLLLRKIGGGYAFLHRILLEHFLRMGGEYGLCDRDEPFTMTSERATASADGVEQTRAPALDRSIREDVLRQVRADWIDGVLNQSLYQVARIELGLQMKSEAVERPLRAIVQAPDGATKAIPAGTAINQIFDDLGSALLILGDPGTGKTTLLLELARDLLGCAERDERQPIPIVLNLSSWAAKRQPLKQWIVKELNERNEVPSRVAQQWLENEQIVLLLDGLDEVSAGHRKACLEAINAFRRDQGLLPIAVCSRIADYEALGTKLRLRSAVVVQPLIESEIEHYLEQIGEPVDGLRAFLKSDPTLLELMKTPLMLWVTLLAYQDRLPDFSTSQNLEERRRQVLSTYIDAVFDRRSAEVRYDKQQTILWLHWLASAMAMRQQSIFYLETLGEDLLPTRLEKWISKIGLILGSGLVCGFVEGLVLPGLYWLGGGLTLGAAHGLTIGFQGLVVGLACGFACGAVLGAAGMILDLLKIRALRIRPVRASTAVHTATRVAWAAAVIVGTGSALIERFDSLRGWRSSGLRDSLTMAFWVGAGLFLLTLMSGKPSGNRSGDTRKARRPLRTAIAEETKGGVVLGLSVWFVRSVLALISNISRRIPLGRNTEKHLQGDPNLRMGRAFIWSLAFGQLGGLVVAVLVGGAEGWPIGCLCGLIATCLFSLFGGGLFYVRHCVLRIILWSKGSAPLNYTQFLEDSRRLSLLRRASGGYLFADRTVMDRLKCQPFGGNSARAAAGG